MSGAEKDEIVPLKPSEGVGTGGAGHVCSGSKSIFRLPPPIPGKPGGGYPQQWHDAANCIGLNWKVHYARLKLKAPQMQDVQLDDDKDAKDGRIRKRDALLGIVGGGVKIVQEWTGKATEKVTKVTSGIVQGAQTYTDKIKANLKREPAEAGELPESRRKRYAGWIMERIKTNKAVGFFLARRQGDSKEDAPFEVACKQEKMQVVEVAARKDIKQVLIVNPGDTLNWTFAVKSHDVIFHLRIRRMMDVGGSQDEELVPPMKVDSNSMGEGTYTVGENESGQAVLVWDNSYSILRSKKIIYRAWIEKGVPKEEGEDAGPVAAESAAQSTPQSDEDLGKSMDQEIAEAKEQAEKEKAAQEAVAKKKAEEEAEAEAKRIAAEKAAAEADAKRVAEEKAAAEAEAKRVAEEKAKAEAEEKAQAEAEAKRVAEEKAKAEAEAKRVAEEKAAAEAEAKRIAEEKAAAEAEAKRIAEEKAKAEAEEKAKAEAEAKRIAEEKAAAEAEAKRVAEEKAKAEAEEKAKAEAEAKRIAEEKAAAEAEEKRIAEEKAAAEAEAKRIADEEAAKKAEEEAAAKKAQGDAAAAADSQADDEEKPDAE